MHILNRSAQLVDALDVAVVGLVRIVLERLYALGVHRKRGLAVVEFVHFSVL